MSRKFNLIWKKGKSNRAKIRSSDFCGFGIGIGIEDWRGSYGQWLVTWAGTNRWCQSYQFIYLAASDSEVWDSASIVRHLLVRMCQRAMRLTAESCQGLAHISSLFSCYFRRLSLFFRDLADNIAQSLEAFMAMFLSVEGLYTTITRCPVLVKNLSWCGDVGLW